MREAEGSENRGMTQGRAELTPSEGNEAIRQKAEMMFWQRKNKPSKGHKQRWQITSVSFGQTSKVQSVMERLWKEDEASDTFIWRPPWISV